ncbi:MAG: hypothetical protein P1U78_01060 [Alcanivoracaceae bacterium]|nr:hypothetical protein [Alcanivoracaceae bacterium]
MRYNKLVAGLILAGAVVAPVYADDHGETPATMPTEADVRDKGAEMKQAGKDKADKMKAKGKEKGAEMKESAGQARDDVVSGEKSAEDAAEEVSEDAEEAGDEMKEEAKKVPPGMAKRDEHPSTGKGSEQGQESRAAEEKSWWRFWD